MKRQGDLLIIGVSAIPPDAKRTESFVLAEGEATGHRHELDGGEVYEQNGELYFHVGDETQVILTHPEHHSITFFPRKYKVIRQREYRPEGWRYAPD